MPSDLAGSDTEAVERLRQERIDPLGLLAQASDSTIEPHRARALYLASPAALAADAGMVPAQTTAECGGAVVPLRQHERPEHREIVLLRMAGYTAREIALRVNQSYSNVTTILRQPWARARLVEHLQRSHDNLQQLLETEAASSLLSQIEMRDDPRVPPAVRGACAADLLDRYMGKAPQTVNINRVQSVESIEDAQRQLDALRAEHARLIGTN